MPYQNSEQEREILWKMRDQLGSWTRVADKLNEPLPPKDHISQALANLVSQGRRNSRKVTKALVASQVYSPPPRNDVRRCWKGTDREAIEIDLWLEENGYNSLKHYVDEKILRRSYV